MCSRVTIVLFSGVSVLTVLLCPAVCDGAVGQHQDGGAPTEEHGDAGPCPGGDCFCAGVPVPATRNPTVSAGLTPAGSSGGTCQSQAGHSGVRAPLDDSTFNLPRYDRLRTFPLLI